MAQDHTADALDYMSDIEIGEALRRTRLYYGKTLADVEAALRIRASQIEAIEKGDMNALPGRVYAIGFVRTYAEYLDLDGGYVVSMFKAQYMDTPQKKFLSFYIPASETQTPPIWLIVLCLISFFVLLELIYSKFSPSHFTELEIIPVPHDIVAHINKDIIQHNPEKIEANLDLKTITLPAIENMASEKKQNQGIILKVLGDSWVEIKNTHNEIIVSNILKQGDEYFVPDFPGLSMSLGNAANVEIILNGRALKPLGGEGDVRRDIPLDTSFLATLEFQDEIMGPVQ
ncbi:MAG: DUF4115 domain-containing protein [Alphaproteobacteria bacterium]|nr:DUF4115 domain-containing protein [Alphaproteobacteria bacterium]